MYETFFGLNEKPFSLTPDPRYFYMSESHREALAGLVYGVRERAGLITVTGPVGVGKTMILASFLDQIREVSEAALFSGSISGARKGFMQDLSFSLNISPGQDSLFGLLQAIKDFAVRKAAEGRIVVVLVDEAQDLGLEELEHFHHLSNLETPETKLVQIVLAGTEKLDDKLGDESLEALRQRVAIRCAVKPIEPEETIEYIFHRIGVAGGASSGLLSDDALWHILNYSRGVPRLINLVCNQAMISAYSSGRLPVDEDAVLEALRELEGGHPEIETEEIAGREAVREMAVAVARRQEERSGPSPSEGEVHHGPNEAENPGSKVESGKDEGIVPRRVGRQGFFARFRPQSRVSPALALVVLLAAGGVFITIGLLKAREDGADRLEPASLEALDAGWGGAPPWQSGLGHGVPKGGAEQTVDGERLSPPEARKDGEPPRGRDGAVQEKDVARIAFQHYGRLDAEVLRALKEKNPQIQDWNNLARDAQLVIPDVPEPANGGVDFYTIQVGAFREEKGASRRASDLAKEGAQNLFLVRGGVDDKFTFVCVGVFESGRESLDSVRTVQGWGYQDAFPLRIRVERLEDILFAFKRDPTGPAAAP